MKGEMNLQVLDCTLRDGGYYGNWDFESTTVDRYLAAMVASKVDIIEVGFRFLPQKKFLGPFAYSTDEYLQTISLPADATIAVMIDAKEILRHKLGVEAVIKKLFADKKSSPVDIVRVAVHAKNVDECFSIVESLHQLGYRVFLNIMQAASLKKDELIKQAQIVSGWSLVEVLYFADSFGNMDPAAVSNTVKDFKKGWAQSIGIHTHDNKGQALLNSIEAINCGVEYIDGTVLGMGRGAGNAKTEYLLSEIVEKGYGEYYPDVLFPLVLHDFSVLQDKFKWGPNIYYFLSALHGIHPTYIQEMLGDERYGTEEILAAISFLKSTDSNFYSLESMLRAISGKTGDETGTWSAKGWAKGKDVLILGSGPSLKRYIGNIQQYANRKKAVVLCANINADVPVDLVTAYVACHEVRVLMEAALYANLGKPLILPLSRVPTVLKESIKKAEILDYGLRIEKGRFKIDNAGCILNSPLALSYAISVATASGASRILLAGVDGYGVTDSRQKEMQQVFDHYESLNSACHLQSITPTTYLIEQRSLFEPGF